MTYERALEAVIAAGLAEDVGTGDLTSEATVPASLHARARLLVKEPGVVAGLDAAAAVFRRLDPGLDVEAALVDGDRVEVAPAVAATYTGNARALLTGERLALNLVQRMSGIATATRRYVAAVEGTGCVVLDTRKTAPGLRALDKRAVLLGGGVNHRHGLYDAVLLKDNHIALAGGIAAAVAAARAAAPALTIEVEARSACEVDQALAACADIILLDNMDIPALRDAVARIGGRARTEASGGITLATIRGVAETGVDAISVGALTHSAPALDLSLELQP